MDWIEAIVFVALALWVGFIVYVVWSGQGDVLWPGNW